MLFSNTFLVDSFPVAWGFFETGLIPAHTDCIYVYIIIRAKKGSQGIVGGK
jgi:hypothetical protein